MATTWKKHRAVRRSLLLLITGGILLTLHTVPTEVVKWKADYEFVPLNATQFLDPKVQTKWESLYPGMPITHIIPCWYDGALKEEKAGAGFGPDGLVYNSTSVTHQLHCVVCRHLSFPPEERGC